MMGPISEVYMIPANRLSEGIIIAWKCVVG